MTTLAALGDSFNCGEGVGVRVSIPDTWSGLLADGLGLDLQMLARPGARLRDVLEQQIRDMTHAHVATVCVGLNDVCRGGFDPETFADELALLVDGLHWRADLIVLLRLHDPTGFVWLPRRLKSGVRRRLVAANTAVDRVASLSPKVRVVDPAELSPLRHRSAWAADGVHPAPYCHAVLAAAAAEALERGHDLRPWPTTTTRAASARHAWWLVRHGAPYVVRNARTFATPVAEGLRRAG